MKYLILITVFTLSCFAAKAQSTEPYASDTTTVYNRVDLQPEFPGGLTALKGFIRDNLKPGNDKGVVFTVFTVERDGKITNIKVLRSLSPTADKEAIRLLSTLPKFKPATKDGKVVRCSFTLPIKFPAL